MSDITLLNKGQSDWQNVVNQNFENINGDIIPFSDTGWLTDGLINGQNVVSASSKYRIVTLGTRKTITIFSSIKFNNALLSATWGTPGSMLLGFPSSISSSLGMVQRTAPTDANVSQIKFVFRDNSINGQYGIYFDNFVNAGDSAANYPSTIGIVLAHQFEVG